MTGGGDDLPDPDDREAWFAAFGLDADPRDPSSAQPPEDKPDPELWDETTARRHLQRTWYPFFASFGRLTATQRRTLPVLLAGHDALVCAPTASGKTEAVTAPLLERILAEEPQPEDVRLLAVAPTRALANDLAQRLELPLGRMGLDVAVRTGDRKTLRQRDRQCVLVTTPESLDSLLCRTPHDLDALRAVFLDELHFVSGGARGDQLRLLVRRLRARAARSGRELQVAAASASLDDTAAAGRLWLRDGHRRVELGRDEARPRPILSTEIHAPTLDDIAAELRAWIERDPTRTRIVFVNRRSDAEVLGDRLRDLRAVVHHGSLSTAERERAETQLRRHPGAVCVCTSTLEVGIDIGRIDEAVLVGPPPDVASFLQRVGRAGRRTRSIEAVYVWSTDADRVRFEVLAELAEQGILFDESPPLRPSVLAQQLVSSAFEDGLRPVDRATAHLLGGDERPAWLHDAGIDALLAALRRDDLLYADAAGRHVPSSEGTERHRKGTLHANLAAVQEIPAIDARTNRILGTIDANRARASTHVAIGGASRRVVAESNRAVLVESSDGAGEALFVARDAPRLTFGLARALARRADLGPDEVAMSTDGHGSTLYHWAGTVWGRLLEELARELKWRPTQAGGVALSMRARFRELPERMADVGDLGPLLELALERCWPKLARALGPGPWEPHVPPHVMRTWVREAARVDDLLAWLERVRIVTHEGA